MNFVDVEKTRIPTNFTPVLGLVALQLPLQLENRHLPSFSQKSVLYTVPQDFPSNQSLIGDRLIVEDKDRVLFFVSNFYTLYRFDKTYRG